MSSSARSHCSSCSEYRSLCRQVTSPQPLSDAPSNHRLRKQRRLSSVAAAATGGRQQSVHIAQPPAVQQVPPRRYLAILVTAACLHWCHSMLKSRHAICSSFLLQRPVVAAAAAVGLFAFILLQLLTRKGRGSKQAPDDDLQVPSW